MRLAFTISLLLVALLAAIPTPVVARCACLDAPEEAARRARQESELQKLPSEKDRGVAREFWKRGLLSDAQQYYKQAVDKAEGEASRLPGLPGVEEHAAVLEREAALFFQENSQITSAAQARELALSHNHEGDAQQRELIEIAQLFEQAGDKQKSAEYYGKLVALLSSTKGRYNPETVAAQQNYQRLARLTASR